MPPLGAVLRMRRNRDRYAKAKPTWEVLWLPATFLAYLVGAIVLRLPTALDWALWGGAWICFVVITDHLIVRLRRRRPPADAGGPLPRRRAWRLATYLAVYLVSTRLAPEGPISLAVVVVVGVSLVLVERAVTRIEDRRDAERRRREMDDLAQRF